RPGTRPPGMCGPALPHRPVPGTGATPSARPKSGRAPRPRTGPDLRKDVNPDGDPTTRGPGPVAPARRAATVRPADRALGALRRPGRPTGGGRAIDALLRAHELREVRDASPLVTYGLYRLLLAVAHDLFAPRGKAEWLALFRRGQFESEPLRRFR